jgi:Tfp pilus assembly protein PilX
MLNFFQKQKGIALMLAIVMVSFVLLVVIFSSAISSGQLKFTSGQNDSTRAFSAADTGIEYALSRINLKLPVGQDASTCGCDALNALGSTWCPSGMPLSSNAEYCVMVDNPATPRKITAVGRTTDTKIRRSLEVLVPAYAAGGNTFNTFCVAGGANLVPNTVCTGLGYAGATGLTGTSAGNCAAADYATAQKTALIISTVDNAGANRSFTTLGTNYYAVQCFK